VARLFFVVFLGLSLAARWGIERSVSAWTVLALILPGFYLGGLRGACLALLLADLALFFLGVWWARPYIGWARPRVDLLELAPYLSFGLTFFASTLLLTAFRASGEAMVRVITGDYTQVGYFGLAYAIYGTAAPVLPMVAWPFAPLFTSLVTKGRVGAVQQASERLLKWLTLCSMLAVFGALLLGRDVVLLVLGTAYRPVAVNLLPMTLALLPLALSTVVRVLALACDRPRAAVAGSGIRLMAFWALGPPLIAWQGSLGGCLAVLIASALGGVSLAWLMWPVARHAVRSGALAIVLGGLFLPLALFRSSWVVNLALYGTFVAGYGSVLLLFRVVTPGEIGAAWQMIRGGAHL